MSVPRLLVVVVFALILTLPFMVRRGAEGGGVAAQGSGGDEGEGTALVIVTPHVAQIREEFGGAFAAWHARRYPHDGRVRIDWRVPGGTSEIVKQLRAEYEAAVRAAARDGRLQIVRWGEDGASCEATLAARSMSADLMFGGGHYEHDQLRAGVKVRVRAGDKTVAALVRISEPAGFEPARMTGAEGSWFRENRIGNQALYDEEQHWIGVALSSFGIVFNRELLAERGLEEPRQFTDLADFRYFRSLALADPRQSGSVTTTYESILNKEGWEAGWRTLREMGANSRSFASASTRPPVDGSQGEALAGLAIDFYGRAQAQAVLAAGEDPATSRVGYVDPRGAVYVDADPVSVLRGCPHPVMARRFIEFCLSDEGQALWQMPPRGSEAVRGNPVGPDGAPLGPARYSLRRLPSREAMYEKYMAHFVDGVNPFRSAAPLPNRGWRRAIDVMMGAFAVDTLEELRGAWEALHGARGQEGVDPETLAEMERLFYAFPRGEDVARLGARIFPTFEFPADALLDFSPEVTGTVDENPSGADNCRRVAATWGDPDVKARLRVVYSEFFRENYRRVAELGRRARG